MSAVPKVLFLCTGNSCRSQLAEALLRHLGAGRIEVHSAGSHPAGFIHPLAIEALSRLNVPLNDPRSKSWDEYAGETFHAVITLCDAAAEEPCPNWPGTPVKAHWSLPDPVYYAGSDEDRVQFTLRIAERLRTKIEGLLELDWSSEREELCGRLAFLGEI